MTGLPVSTSAGRDQCSLQASAAEIGHVAEIYAEAHGL